MTAEEYREAEKRLRALCQMWAEDHYNFIQLNIGEAEAAALALRSAAEQAEQLAFLMSPESGVVEKARAIVAAEQAERMQEMRELLQEAYDHLEYCGYGDSWERECAMEAKLPKRLAALLERDR